MIHGLLGAASSTAAASASTAFTISAQFVGPEIGALHAVEPINRIDHWRLCEGTHQLLKGGVAQAKYGVQYRFAVLVAVLY